MRRFRPISGPGVRVICSTPTTSVMRARFASIVLIAWWTAAEPVAQAFSTRVAGLKRKLSLACSTSEAVKSCGEKPALKWPSTISSTSAGLDAGVLQRLVGDPDDQALDGLVVELAEGRVGPADDAGGHGAILAIRSKECGGRRGA